MNILINPFIIGLLSGLLTGNISLALITTGFIIFVWGRDRLSPWLIISILLLVLLTGNINFELIFIYFISLAYFVRKSQLSTEKGFIIAASISIILYPCWRHFFGLLPAQLLNDINIAGELLVLGGLALSINRGVKLIRNRAGTKDIFRYFIRYIMAGLGITGNLLVIPCWITGIILLSYLERREPKYELDDRSCYYIVALLSIFFMSFLLPVNLALIIGFLVIGLYVFMRSGKEIFLETSYIALLMGVLASRAGLLN